METDGVGNPQAVYTYGNGLISMNRSGVNAYYHSDGLGSVRQLTNASGQGMVSYMYDGFGNVRTVSGTADNPYGFTGESQLAEADNLIFLRARYYAPALGRFLSRDPILTPVRLQGYVGWLLPYLNLHESPQALHPYLYVLNNPLRYIDPMGLAAKDVNLCYEACNAYASKQKWNAGAVKNFLESCYVNCWNIYTNNPSGCGSYNNIWAIEETLKGMEKRVPPVLRKIIDWIGRLL